jgi:hypothetical protein
MNLPTKLLLTTAVGATLVVQSSAQSIGVNFLGDRPAEGTLAASDVAGLVPQSNYNNLGLSFGTNIALFDNLGAATLTTLTYSSGGNYATIRNGTPLGGDEILNTGYVFGNSSFTLSNIPYAEYSLIIYTLNDGQRNQVTTVEGVQYFGRSPSPGDTGFVDRNAETAYNYINSTTTAPAAGTDPAFANYVRVDGLTSSTVTFSATAPGNGYVNGFQVVAVPEPSTAALLGLAGAAVALRRRRK